jgi:hypothetical protein
MKNAVQLAIIICSCTSAWFISRKGSSQRWGFVVGLAGQPFWMWSSLQTGDWGIFLVSCWFTWRHIVGIRNHWKAAATQKGGSI